MLFNHFDISSDIQQCWTVEDGLLSDVSHNFLLEYPLILQNGGDALDFFFQKLSFTIFVYTHRHFEWDFLPMRNVIQLLLNSFITAVHFQIDGICAKYHLIPSISFALSIHIATTDS